MRRGARLVSAAAVELAEGGVPQVVAQEPARRLDRLEQGEARLRPLPLGERDRAVQRVDGRGSDAVEELVEPRDLVPACLTVAAREAVLGGDGRLDVIAGEHVSPS